MDWLNNREKACTQQSVCNSIQTQWVNSSPTSAVSVSVNQVSIGSNNGLSPIRRQAIILTSAGLLSIGILWTNFREILNKIQTTRQIWGIWKLLPAYSPETPNLGQNRWCFVPCDLENWWMTLENNRASLLCCFKLCASFHSHWWIQTGVTVRKRPIWVKFDDF